MKRIIGFFVLVLVLSNFMTYAQTATGVKDITVKQLKQQIKNDSSLVILDVRTPKELTGPLGKIDDVINIPLQQLQDRIGELNNYKHQEIVVICRTGHRSGIASKILARNGFTDIENVEGGMTAYRKNQNN